MDLAQLKRAHVLVTGDAMLDRYWFGDAERISPEAPVPVVRVTRTEERLGGAANVARNIATVGASSTLLSVVGNDEAGQSIEKLLRAEGIQPELELDPALKTTVKLRVVARQQQLVRCDFEAMPAEETLKRHLGTFSKLLTTNQALVLSDYGKGGLSHISTMIAEARAVKLPILVDPKGWMSPPPQGGAPPAAITAPLSLHPTALSSGRLLAPGQAKPRLSNAHRICARHLSLTICSLHVPKKA